MKRRRGDQLVAVALVGALVLVAGLVGLASLYLGKINQAMTSLGRTEGLPDYTGRPVPADPAEPRALNYVVLNLDSSGQLAAVIVVHLSAERDALRLVALPADLLVPQSRAGEQTLGEAYATGAGAVVRAVEALFGVRMDHLMVLSLPGFARLIDVVGPVSVPNPAPASAGNQHWPAGRVNLTAAAAAAYLDAPADSAVRLQRTTTVVAAVFVRLVEIGAVTTAANLDAITGNLAHCLRVDPDLTPERLRSTVLELRLTPESVVPVVVPLLEIREGGGNSVSVADPAGVRHLAATLAGDPGAGDFPPDPWAALAAVPRR